MCHEEGAAKVDLEFVPPGGGIGILEGGADAVHAGVVDEDVGVAVLFLYCGIEGLNRCGVCEISGDGKDFDIGVGL